MLPIETIIEISSLPLLPSEFQLPLASRMLSRMALGRKHVLGSGLVAAVLLFVINAQDVVAAEESLNRPFGTNYSEWHHTVNFSSSSQHQVRGMEPFYNITNMILKWFEPEPMIPDGELIKSSLCAYFRHSWRKVFQSGSIGNCDIHVIRSCLRITYQSIDGHN